MAKRKHTSSRKKRSTRTVKPGLGSQKIVAFVATRDPQRAKAFYRDTLGLRLVSEDSFALVFRIGGIMLRVTTVHEVATAPYTVLGWHVTNVAATIKSLVRAGVTFERYPGLAQDERGVWTAPGGARIAWFKDPDGNTLSITQF
jgi:catechol 2,3-dioxygenase-like lactoylglutathione lyase family enzyme